MYASVITDIRHENVNQTYDYIIPNHLIDEIEVGMRVIVPFGEQTRLAYILEIKENSEFANKEISDCIDVVPSIKPLTFELVDLLLQLNKKPYVEALRTVLPKELFVSYKKVLKVIESENLNNDLKPFIKNGFIEINKDILHYNNLIKKEINNGKLKLVSVYKKRASDKKISICTYNEHNQYSLLDKYMDIISYVQESKSIPKATLKKIYGNSKINTLIKHGVLIEKEVLHRKELKHYFENYNRVFDLTLEQINAINRIKENYDKPATILLKGVTGSGKTEVYLNIIEEMLKSSKKVLFLVPEITLIGPMLQALQSRFDESIAVYHSNLTQQERFEQYRMIEDNMANIILGTRSASFIDIENLGLIIVDEAHDQSYIQTEGVEYDAIDILKYRSKRNSIPLVLGTATPSIEQMYLAQNNEYLLVEMHERATQMPLPKLSIVDMRNELVLGNTTIFSKLLKEKIEDRLSKKEQVVLLFNRKGYAPFVMCRQCGDVPKCEKCQVALTYHKSKNILKCRYCDHTELFEKVCKTCNSTAIKPVGIGIEYIEEQVKKHFKDAKVLRMDRDALTKKGSEEEVWQDFYNEKANILIGTQMIAKGLDFPKVTLSAILMADMAFKVSSYKASEQAYILFTQMIGRSGRTLPGEAIIQGYDLDHYAIKSLFKSYEDFYEKALYDRKLSLYEPFGKIHHIMVSGESYLKTYQSAFKLMKHLRLKKLQVLGPTESFKKTFSNLYQFILTIKGHEINYNEIFETISQIESKEIKISFHPIAEII